MRGLRLNFSKTGPALDFSGPLVDFDTTVQNALVNLVTASGSDQLYPDRGTTLQLDGAQGRMVNQVWAQQAGNFAALAVLNFSQKTEIQSNAFKLQKFAVTSTRLQSGQAVFSVSATSVAGVTVGQQVAV